MDLATYIPKEIWCMIMFSTYDQNKCEFILSPKDLDNMGKVAPVFADLLKSERTSYLFSKVYPMIRPGLRISKIPSLRLVCKRWMNGLDNFYTNHPSLEPYDNVKHHYAVTSPYYSVPDDCFFVSLISNRGIQRKLLSVVDLRLNSNSIRGKKVEFNLSVHNESPNKNEVCSTFFENIRKLLEKIGRYVFYLDVLTFNTTIECTTVYVSLQKYMQLLPNLRAIKFEVLEVEYDNTNENYAQNLIASYPLPPSAALNTLDLKINGLPDALRNYIFSCYGKAIRKVVSLPPTLMGGCRYFLHLTELELHRIHNTRMVLMLLRESANLGMHLQKLVCELNVDFNILEVLDGLRPLRTIELRLKRMEIESGSIIEGDNITDYEPILSLQTLELEDGPFLTYNFLSLLPNLKFLYLRRRQDYVETDYPFEPIVRNEVNSDIFCCLYFAFPLPSSFWFKFPSLQEVYTMHDDMEVARRDRMKYRFSRPRCILTQV